MVRVLLTDAIGYVGQHCAAELPRQGYEAAGTNRNPAVAESTRIAIEKVAPVDRVSIVDVDLLSKTGWDEATEGCTLILHIASPFVLAQPMDENEMIITPVEGTKRVIAAAQQARVKRLVLTSSTFSIIAGNDSDRYGIDVWSDTNANTGAYAISKTLAKRRLGSCERKRNGTHRRQPWRGFRALSRGGDGWSER